MPNIAPSLRQVFLLRARPSPIAFSVAQGSARWCQRLHASAAGPRVALQTHISAVQAEVKGSSGSRWQHAGLQTKLLDGHFEHLA